MALGVYDRDFRFAHALCIVRRYVDRNAQYNKDRTGIVYWQFRDHRTWQPAKWSDGSLIRTRTGHVIETPQYTKECCFLPLVEALQMVDDLSQE
jgi:hypothetical protein